MSPLLDHVWGVSQAQDRVLAEVAGIAPSTDPLRRLLLVLQAYIDDSYTKGGVFVLAGYIATAEAWGAFAKEWEQLLPSHGVQDNDGRYHFKMSEMAMSDERMSRVPAFYRVIEKHVLMALSCAYNVEDLERAKRRVWVPRRRIDWAFMDNPYLVAWRTLMDMFHNIRSGQVDRPPSEGDAGKLSKVLPENQCVDFYFDEQSEHRLINDMWFGYLEERHDKTRPYYGSAPRFVDDKTFLPVQAADFWAWWVRKWHQEGVADRKISENEFGLWDADKYNHPRLHISMSDKGFIEYITSTLHQKVEPGTPVYVHTA